MDETNEYSDSAEASLHIESQTSECTACQNKRKYVQIIDVDRYIDNLNDWD